jgi:outer membrane protein TolC
MSLGQAAGFALLAVACLGPHGLAAGEVVAGNPATVSIQRLTLDDCIAIALQNQPAIHAQQAALGVATEQQKIARSYFLPQVGLSSRYTVLDKPLTFEFPSPLSGSLGNLLADSAAFFGIARQAGSAAANLALNNPNLPPFSTARQAALNAQPSTIAVDVFGDSLFTNQVLLTQPLYTGGKICYRNQQAHLGIEAAGADVVQSKQRTIYEVSRAYYGALLSLELVRVADDAVGQFRAIERLAQSLLDQGDEFVTTADLYRIRALRLLAESQRVEFQRAVDLAQAALRQAMGLELLTPLALAEERLEYKPVAIPLPEVLAQALARRPEVIKAGIGVRNTVLQEKLADAQFHPNVGLFASVSTINGERTFPNPGNAAIWAMGVSAEMPLYVGGRRLAERRQAQQQHQQANQVLKLVQDLVTLEVQQVHLEYQETAQRLPLAEAAVRDADATLKAYHDQFAANLIAAKDMPKHFENLTTVRLLLSLAQASYNQQVYAYNLALAKIRLVTAADE